MRGTFSKAAIDQLRSTLNALRRDASERRATTHPVIGAALMPRLTVMSEGAGTSTKIGKPKDTDHNPDTWHTYIVWQLESTGGPTATADEVQAWNESGRVFSKELMHGLMQVGTGSADPEERYISFVLEYEPCP